MSDIKLSFVVPLFNHVEHSKTMLDSLLKSLPPDLIYEVILINDASSDGTENWLELLDHPNLIKINNPYNLGYAKSNNIAARQARGKYLVLINNDLLFSDGWLEPMISIMESTSLNAGVVGNVQYSIKDHSIDHAGVYLNLKGQFTHIRDYDKELAYGKCLAVTGACLLVSKLDYDQIHLFDEAFLNGGEDIDLCFAIRKLGKNIYVCHESKIGHHVSLSRDRSSIQNEINSRYLNTKWREPIKDELSKNWAHLLACKDEKIIYSFIDGELLDTFTSSPYTASRLLAEHFIIREEDRWNKIIDGLDLNKDIVQKCSANGLRFIKSHQCYLIEKEVFFYVKDIQSVINFYVCGRRIDPTLRENLAIVINVNNIQVKKIELPQDPNINVGVLNPILLFGMNNQFKISVHFIDPVSKEILGSANESIVITHFVINDFIVNKF